LLADGEGLDQRRGFLHRGPTTDNVNAHLFREGDRLAITLEFCREEHLPHHEHIGAVFTVEIDAEELIEILR
jgi:hypothetical protein